MLNKVFLIGNLTRDPDVRYIPSGTALTEFDLAVNRRFKNRNNEMQEETLFIRIITWGKQAEFCAEYLKKGRQVLVEGRLKKDTWEAKDGSGKRSRIDVVAENVNFIGPRPGSDQQRDNRQQAPSSFTPDQERSGSSQGAPGGESYTSQDIPSDDSATEDDLPF